MKKIVKYNHASADLNLFLALIIEPKVRTAAKGTNLAKLWPQADST